MAKILGYQEDLSKLPVRRGDVVTIPAGIAIHTMGPEGPKVSGRRYRVKVHRVGCGQNYPVGHDLHDDRYPVVNPTIVWAGAGKYWHEADINDVLGLKDD